MASSTERATVGPDDDGRDGGDADRIWFDDRAVEWLVDLIDDICTEGLFAAVGWQWADLVGELRGHRPDAIGPRLVRDAFDLAASTIEKLTSGTRAATRKQVERLLLEAKAPEHVATLGGVIVAQVLLRPIDNPMQLAALFLRVTGRVLQAELDHDARRGTGPVDHAQPKAAVEWRRQLFTDGFQEELALLFDRFPDQCEVWEIFILFGGVKEAEWTIADAARTIEKAKNTIDRARQAIIDVEGSPNAAQREIDRRTIAGAEHEINEAYRTIERAYRAIDRAQPTVDDAALEHAVATMANRQPDDPTVKQVRRASETERTARIAERNKVRQEETERLEAQRVEIRSEIAAARKSVHGAEAEARAKAKRQQRLERAAEAVLRDSRTLSDEQKRGLHNDLPPPGRHMGGPGGGMSL